MARLFEFVESLADDDMYMAQLSEICGLSSAVDGRRAYRAAVELVERQLLGVSSNPIETKSLLRTVHSLQRSERHAPADIFAAGSSVDDVVFNVFGEDADRVISALTGTLSTSQESARSVLETTTAVVVSSIGQLGGEGLTFEALESLLAAERPEAGAESDELALLTVPDATPATRTRTDERVAAAPAVDGPGKAPKALLLAIPVLLVAGAGVAWLTTSGGDDATTIAFSDETTTATDDDQLQTTTSEGTEAGSDQTSEAAQPAAADAGADDTTGADETAGEDDTDPIVVQEPEVVAGSPPVPIGAPNRYAVMSQGQIFLRGTLTSEEEREQILAAVQQIVGPGMAVSEYVIDPAYQAEENSNGTPVYVEDAVLFATGSNEIAPDFVPLLGVGLRLLQVQPGVTLEVTGHTDSDGSDEANLALSQNRVDVVKEFFVAQGIDPARVIAVGKGESEPRADNGTAEGRQANRRVEFLVKGFSYGG